MSILACFCTSSLATAATAPASETSTTCVPTSPCLDSVFLVRSRTSRARSQSDTEAPDSSNRVAMASPMPCAAPVKTACLPFKSISFTCPVLLLKLDRGIYIVPDNKHTLTHRRRELCTVLLSDWRERERSSGEDTAVG